MRPGLSRIPRKFCGNCRIEAVDYPRCICLFCEQEQRQIDHDRIVRAQVLTIMCEPESRVPSPSGRPIRTLRKRA
jgi:hypothetical protein